MVRKLVFFLSIVFTAAALVWILEAPNDLEPKITFIGGLIGILTTYPFKKKSSSALVELGLTNTAVINERKNDSDFQNKDVKPVSQPLQPEISPTVFISYAHDSEEHKQYALDLADKLNGLGIDCWIDRYVEDNPPSRGWPMWMEERIRLSSFILLICSERYLARMEGREEKAKGRGVKFESILLVQSFYDNDSINERIIPVLLYEKDAKFIPAIFRAFTHYCVAVENQFESLYRRLTNQPKITKPTLGKIKKLNSKGVDVTQEQNVGGGLNEFTNNMKQAHKIMQTFLSLPLTRRFEIGQRLGLLENGESVSSPNADQISAMILVRAKQKNQMASLWSLLFNESIDPNPFKT